MRVALDYLALTKPKLLLMALATTYLGFYAASIDGFDMGILVALLLGAAFVGASANAFNQYLESDVDARMQRTEQRPLPSGRMNSTSALVFAIITGILGVVLLILLVDLETGIIGLLTIISYAFVYTPLKRLTPINTLFGAIPGALPILMGWAAVGSAFEREAWVLFAFLFVWQIPHFLAIAWIYREDYRRSGLKMLPSDDPNGRVTAWEILVCNAILVFTSLLPGYVGMTGVLYFGAACFFGIILMVFSIQMVMTRLKEAKMFVRVTIIYLTAVILFMVIDRL